MRRRAPSRPRARRPAANSASGCRRHFAHVRLATSQQRRFARDRRTAKPHFRWHACRPRRSRARSSCLDASRSRPTATSRFQTSEPSTVSPCRCAPPRTEPRGRGAQLCASFESLVPPTLTALPPLPETPASSAGRGKSHSIVASTDPLRAEPRRLGVARHQAGCGWRLPDRFSFRIIHDEDQALPGPCKWVDHTPGSCARRGGDGFAFVVQNFGEQSLGQGGGGLGYGGIPNEVAVEFDTWFDSNLEIRTRTTSPCSPEAARSFAPNTAPTSACVSTSPIWRTASATTFAWSTTLCSARSAMHRSFQAAPHLVDLVYPPRRLSARARRAQGVDRRHESTGVDRADEPRRVSGLGGGTAWVGFTASTGRAIRITRCCRGCFSSRRASTARRARGRGRISRRNRTPYRGWRRGGRMRYSRGPGKGGVVAGAKSGTEGGAALRGDHRVLVNTVYYTHNNQCGVRFSPSCQHHTSADDAADEAAVDHARGGSASVRGAPRRTSRRVVRDVLEPRTRETCWNLVPRPPRTGCSRGNRRRRGRAQDAALRRRRDDRRDLFPGAARGDGDTARRRLDAHPRPGDRKVRARGSPGGAVFGFSNS